MKAVILAVAVVLAGCAGVSRAPRGEPWPGAEGSRALPVRVWQLQDYNMDHIRRVVGIAGQYGVNRLQLSHAIVMFAEEVLDDPNRQADFREIIDLAHAQGIAVDMWTHELARVPDELLAEDGRVDLDNEAVWMWLDGKYEDLFQAVPSLDGLVLTFHETDYSVYHDHKVKSAAPPAQRVARLIDTLAAVCERHGATLFVRTFCYEPQELAFIKDGLAAARSTFVVMSKEVPHDWEPFYPPNPLLGDVGGRPQIMETDLGGEYYGQSRILYCSPEYLKSRLSYGVSKGCVGVVARIERYDQHALGTPAEVNLFALARLWADPGADVEQIWRDWAQARYGPEAAEGVVSALKRTDDISNRIFFPLGFWLSAHSRVPSLEYMERVLPSASVAKWSDDPVWKQREWALLHPTEEVVQAVSLEKDEARWMCVLSLRDIENVSGRLDPADYGYLRAYFLYAMDCLEVFRYVHESFLRYKMYEQAPPEAKPKAEATLVVSLNRLKDAARVMRYKYGEEVWPGNPGRAEDLIREILERLEK